MERAKLEGKALVALPENANTIAAITEALYNEINPDASEIVEDKMLSLRLVKGNFTKFAEEANKSCLLAK